MKITRKSKDGERREMLLQEYFINAYLIALLKRVGEEVGKVRSRPERKLVEARVPIR